MPTWSTETIARTRVLPPRWYTYRGSHNRKVTRVKKDVRVNLARCISGDELIPPISLGLPVSPSLPLSLLLCPSPFSPLPPALAASREMCHPLIFPVPPYHPSFWTVAMGRSFLATTHRVEFLFIYGGFNEP